MKDRIVTAVIAALFGAMGFAFLRWEYAVVYATGILVGYFIYGKRPLTRALRIRRYRRYLAREQEKRLEAGPYRMRGDGVEVKRVDLGMWKDWDLPAPTRLPGDGAKVKR